MRRGRMGERRKGASDTAQPLLWGQAPPAERASPLKKKHPKTLQKWEGLGLCLFNFIFGGAQAARDSPEQLLPDAFAFSFPS